MLEIHVHNSELTDSVVAVSWCVDKETAIDLIDKNANVVFVVCPELPEDYKDSSFKESRTIAPFKDGMAYLELRYPGKNYIYAFITTESKSDVKEYLSRSRGSYNMMILEQNGRQFASINTNDYGHEYYAHNAHRGTYRDTIEVNVPEGVFAPEPPEWEKPWVNYFFWRDKPVDQCNYRGRRILAYTLQPLFFLLRTLVVFVITAIAFSIGSKAFSLKYLLHPLTYDFVDIIGLFGPSIFVRDVKAKSDSAIDQTIYKIKKYGLFVFAPIVYPIYIGLILKIKIVLFACAVIAAIIFGLIPLIALINFIVNTNWFKTKFKALFAWLAYRFMPNDNYDDLVCNGQPLPEKVQDLSPKRRSIRLRFSELKSKVCKPFRG